MGEHGASVAEAAPCELIPALLSSVLPLVPGVACYCNQSFNLRHGPHTQRVGSSQNAKRSSRNGLVSAPPRGSNRAFGSKSTRQYLQTLSPGTSSPGHRAAVCSVLPCAATVPLARGAHRPAPDRDLEDPLPRPAEHPEAGADRCPGLHRWPEAAPVSRGAEPGRSSERAPPVAFLPHWCPSEETPCLTSPTPTHPPSPRPPRSLAALDKLYHGLNQETFEEVLADDFAMSEVRCGAVRFGWRRLAGRLPGWLPGRLPGRLFPV